jgi:hypothetical protein
MVSNIVEKPGDKPGFIFLFIERVTERETRK